MGCLEELISPELVPPETETPFDPAESRKGEVPLMDRSNIGTIAAELLICFLNPFNTWLEWKTYPGYASMH